MGLGTLDTRAGGDRSWRRSSWAAKIGESWGCLAWTRGVHSVPESCVPLVVYTTLRSLDLDVKLSPGSGVRPWIPHFPLALRVE